MLPDRYRQLLTAYVDGELSARQKRLALKLLRRSAEARRLLEKLQADSQELRALPPVRLERDLSGAVLQKLPHRRMPRIRTLTPATVPVWPAIAAAAAILVIIAGSSYLYFAHFSLASHSDDQQAQQKAPPEVLPPEPKKVPVPHIEEYPDTPPKDGSTPDTKDPDKTPRPIEIVENKPPKLYGPPEDWIPPYALTDRLTDMMEFKMALDGPPLYLRLHDLDQEATKLRLAAELKKGAGFRMEMPCANATKALERLRGILKDEQRILLTLKPAEVAKLKSPHYALFLENLTPDELAQICQRLGAEDKKAAAKRDAHFDRLFVFRMSDKDHKELQRSLGVDPVTSAPRTGPTTIDPRKPLSEQTADQVTRSMMEKANKNVPPQALVLPYPAKRLSSAQDIKRFLDSRRPARPGTLQVLLVLRGV
jgi:hypothetical protein